MSRYNIPVRDPSAVNPDSEVTISTILDGYYGTTQGGILYRGSDNWYMLAPGTSGQLLASGGSSANPSFIAAAPRLAKVSLIGVSSTSGGGIATWQPVEAVPVVVARCVVNVTVVSTGAANLSVGEGTSSTTSYTNLITASDVHTAAIFLDSLTLQTAAVAAQALLMPTANFVTFSANASTVGMVAEALIEYWIL